jgi:hypothetical protein
MGDMKSLGYSKCVFLNGRPAGGRTGREKRHRVTPGSGRNSWGVPGRCPAEDKDRSSGSSGVFVFGRFETGTAYAGIFICGSGRTCLQMIPEVSYIVPDGAAAGRPPDWFD